MITGFYITGDKELERLFKQLPDSMVAPTIRSIARKAAAPVRKRAREKVPVKSGTLKKGIKIITSKSKRWPHVIVGPNYSRAGHRAPHAHLVAFGSKQRTSSKGNRGRAMTHKEPLGDFVQKSAHEVQDEVYEKLMSGLEVVLERQIRKLT